MDKHDQLPFTGYLDTIQAQLGKLTPEQRERILQELQQHLHDAAQQAGANPDDPTFQAEVIQRLGRGQRLGRAFARTYRTPLMNQAQSDLPCRWRRCRSQIGRAHV